MTRAQHPLGMQTWGMNMADTTKTAKLTIDGNEFELPIYSPTAGPDVIDIRKLYAQAGVFTYDPGFTSTASTDSTITFIDGGKGELLHRGYPIDQLAAKSHYLEVCYLLLYGELPTGTQLEDFEARVTNHTMLHEQMMNFFRGFRRDAHPMAIMVGVVGAMSAFYHDSTDISDPWQREVASIRLIAKMPTIAAMAFKYHIGQPFVYPRNDLDYASNFLRMCFSVPAEEYEVLCDLRLHPVRTRSHVLPLVLLACGVLHMVAQTRHVSRCCAKSELWTAFQSLSPVQRTRMIHSA